MRKQALYAKIKELDTDIIEYKKLAWLCGYDHVEEAAYWEARAEKLVEYRARLYEQSLKETKVEKAIKRLKFLMLSLLEKGKVR
jgi:hypothetical protein